MKNDKHARDCWGRAYDAIPKSVFATACYHLADINSADGADNGGAWQRFVEEMDALHNHLAPGQADNAAKQVRAVINKERKFKPNVALVIGYGENL